MSKNYAKRFTKEDLIKAGIKEITSDYKVVYNSGRTLEKEEDFTQLKQGYLVFSIYALDENGNKIKVPVKRKFKNCKNLIREIKNSNKGENGKPREDFDDHTINASEYAWAPIIQYVKMWKSFKLR